MTITTLTAPHGAAQQQCSQSHASSTVRLQTLESLPHDWRKGLICIGRHKQPIDPRTGGPLANWPSAPMPALRDLIEAPAVGLITGTRTNCLCLDFDGEAAWQVFEQLFGGKAKELLPQTIAWTSGKPMRCQAAFKIPLSDQELLVSKRRKIGALELRWNGQQSVLMGHHPETGAYKWLKGKAPWETSLATFPIELLGLVPSVAAAPARPRASRAGFGLVVPLDQFITLRSRAILASGSAAGSCNSDALALSIDLVAAEAWVKAQGASPDQTAEEAFYDYCSRCPQTINGKAFDWRAMAARFNGAVARCPEPPTPESKLLERLAYHRRMAARNARQEVAA